MIDKYQFACVKIQCGCFRYKDVLQLLFYLWTSSQKPQIGFVRPTHERILVTLMVKFKYDIGTIKRAKKRNFQVTLIRSSNEVGVPFSFFPCLFFL